RLLVSVSRTLEDIEAHAIATELENSLHNWMLFRLRPSSRVDRQYEQFALSDEGCEGVQQLHPCRQRLRPGNEAGVHRRPGAKRYRQDVAPEPDPLLAHSCAQRVALRAGHGEAPDNALQKQLHAVANQPGGK